MNDLIAIKSIKSISPASFKSKATTRNTALIFPNLKKAKAQRNYISAWVDTVSKPLTTIEDYAEKTVVVQNCNDVMAPVTPNSYAHIFEEQFEPKLLPVLVN